MAVTSTDLVVLFVLLYVALVVTENAIKLIKWWKVHTKK